MSFGLFLKYPPACVSATSALLTRVSSAGHRERYDGHVRAPLGMPRWRHTCATLSITPARTEGRQKRQDVMLSARPSRSTPCKMDTAPFAQYRGLGEGEKGRRGDVISHQRGRYKRAPGLRTGGNLANTKLTIVNCHVHRKHKQTCTHFWTAV